MRLLSILAFVGLVSAASISSANLVGRATCNPGQGGQTASSSSCTTCGYGTFSQGGNGATCQKCPTGSSSTPGSAYCTCNAGYFKDGGGTTTGDPCTTCAAGQYNGATGASSCTSCPAGSYSAPGATSCGSRCPQGYSHAADSSECLPFTCPAGRYILDNLCGACFAGTYSAGGRIYACTSCPAGTYSPALSAACITCPAGSTSNAAAKSCTPCPADTYATGNTCAPCPGNPAGSSTCGPQPSKRAVQPVLDTCSWMPGHKRCPVWSNGGRSECINIFTALDSCGGCVGVAGEDDGSFTGKDCSMIPNVDEVKCERGRCNVMSCRNGYIPTDGACVGMSRINAKHGASMLARHDSF